MNTKRKYRRRSSTKRNNNVQRRTNKKRRINKRSNRRQKRTNRKASKVKLYGGSTVSEVMAEVEGLLEENEEIKQQAEKFNKAKLDYKSSIQETPETPNTKNHLKEIVQSLIDLDS